MLKIVIKFGMQFETDKWRLLNVIKGKQQQEAFHMQNRYEIQSLQ